METTHMPTTSWTTQFDQRIWFLFIVAWGASYTVLAITIMPLLVHVWMRQLGVPEDFVGYLASIDALGGTVGLFVSGWAVARSNLPRVALLGLMTALSCDLASIFVWNVPSLAFFRGISGFGSGIALGAFVGWFARHQQADRCFGLFALCQFSQGAAAMALMPSLETRFGLSSIYLCLIFFGIFGCATTVLLGNETPRTPHAEVNADTPKTLRFSWYIVLVIAAGALYNAFTFGLTTYAEIYALSLGYPKDKIDFALASGSFVGVPGTLIMIVLSNRFGRLKPIFISLTVLAASIGLLLVAKPPFSLLAAQYIITGVSWSFGYPYVQAIQSALDPTGRVAIYGTVAAAVGAVAGPSIFATVIDQGTYHTAFLVTLLTCIVCLIMLLAPARRADQMQIARKLGHI
jgi:MFS family permease